MPRYRGQSASLRHSPSIGYLMAHDLWLSLVGLLADQTIRSLIDLAVIAVVGVALKLIKRR
jgi:hypothetical protein